MIHHFQIEWRHSNKLLAETEALTIERVNAIDHNGSLVCVARNEYGTISKTIDLIVLSMRIFLEIYANAIYRFILILQPSHTYQRKAIEIFRKRYQFD